MPRSLIDGILGSLIVSGIVGLIVLYGDAGKLQSEMTTNRREIDSLQKQVAVYGEAIARAEERIKLGCPK